MTSFARIELINTITTALEQPDPMRKQYYLEKLLERLVGKDEFDFIKEEMGWPNGLVP